MFGFGDFFGVAVDEEVCGVMVGGVVLVEGEGVVVLEVEGVECVVSAVGELELVVEGEVLLWLEVCGCGVGASEWCEVVG